MNIPQWHLWTLLVMACFLFGGNCVQERYLRYESPDEDFLNVGGTIDDGMKYVVIVTYVQKVQGSNCQDYDKKTGLCRERPQTFTYLPRINGRSHHVHIPLKELSPGADSWWAPYDISICVGPKVEPSQPHQCQRLFILTNTTQDSRPQIDLECSDTWWCAPRNSELRVAEISEINREYILNISRISSR